MSHFNFVIPLHRDDLFEAPTRNQYVVDNVYNMRDLKIKLQDMAQSLREQGADFVLFEGFDVIFSLLGEFNKNATPDMKSKGVELTVQGMTSLVDQLAQLFNSGNSLDTDERLRNLNKMKMMLYLFCQIIQKMESEQNQHDPLTGGKQKGKKKSKDDDFSGDWDQERRRSVSLLYNLVQLNLNQLFEPPIIEEEVLSIIGFTLFKILENPNLALVKCKDVRLSIIQVLATINKRFNYTLSCSLKFVQQLKHFEHLVSVFSQATEVMVREYGLTGMVLELVREISRVDTKELSRDTSGTRAYSQFLVELAERLPEYIRPSVSLLTTHLNGESYAMRKCVLGVLGEIVAKVLTKEELTDADRDDRDNFLDCLEDHIHDVHAHVRSHVLQIWARLCSQKCIPLARQHKLLELTAGRLQDKSSNVRKAAVQLLNTLLQSNPFAAKLQTEELEERLKEEKEKLVALEPLNTMEPLELWSMIEDKIEEGLSKETTPGTETDEVWENAAVGEVNHRIAAFLDRHEVARARALLRHAQKTFPTEPIYKDSEADDEAMEEEREEDEEEEGETSTTKMLRIMKNIFLECKKTPEPSLSQSQNNSEEEISKQKMLVQYLGDSVKFSKIIHKSLPIVAQLLGSKVSSDILEAIDFFVSAFEFGMHNALLGVRKMLALIWSREAAIKEAVVSAYKRLYINVECNKARIAAAAVSRNLIALVKLATLGELTSLEMLISELVASKDIGKPVFTVLWEYFTGVLPDSSPEDATPAITLLRMCAVSEVSIITSNIQVIIEHGLGEKGQKNHQLAQQACNALLKIVPAKLKQDDPEPPLKYKQDHKLFESLEVLLVEGLYNKLDPHYMPMAKAAVKVVYQLGEGPDTFLTSVVRTVCARINDKRPETGDVKVGTYILRRLCFLVGEIALNQLNYLDVNVFNELKRRNFLREAKQETEKKKKAAEKKKKRQSIMRVTALGTPLAPNNAEDDDMGVVGAEADDAEAEFIRHVTEKEILCGETLLNSFTPLLVSICSNPTKYQDPDLRSSAGLALCKYMLMSAEFADKHLQRIFTMLEKEKDHVLRANLIIALGDLSFRFPNNLEPWTPKMYARLHDESIKVRSNTLTVLTHLILNDMIKVKGQISDMAFCIVDNIDKIAGLAKLFFAELAKKGNTLYNVMPDIVSRLSDPEIGIAEDSFRNIMKFIIGLIEKDKLLESLVEKLCHRFRATRTKRQWRDISYCLSLFPYSERSFRKLNENFTCWSDKLHEDSVYDSFQAIFASTKKGVGQGQVGVSRTEIKTLVEELEAKVEEARAKAVEDDTTDRRAKEARQAKAKGKVRRGRKDESSDEEIEAEAAKVEGATGERRKSRRSEASKKKKIVEESEEEEEEEEEEEDEEDEDEESDEVFEEKEPEDKPSKKESTNKRGEKGRRDEELKQKGADRKELETKRNEKAARETVEKGRKATEDGKRSARGRQQVEETPDGGRKERSRRMVDSGDSEKEDRPKVSRNEKSRSRVLDTESEEEEVRGPRSRKKPSASADTSDSSQEFVERPPPQSGRKGGRDRLAASLGDQVVLPSASKRSGRGKEEAARRQEVERVRSRSRRDQDRSSLHEAVDSEEDFRPEETTASARKSSSSSSRRAPAPTPKTAKKKSRK